MKLSQFEELVREALAGLPPGCLDKMSNVDVVVEQWPSTEDLLEADVSPAETLLGLYVGIPMTEREGYNMALPDKITIYQAPIEDQCQTEVEMEKAVRETVMHELAHHFGIDDDQLIAWGL
jgi:predicted Zn-dependent protease with MMP-like domain